MFGGVPSEVRLAGNDRCFLCLRGRPPQAIDLDAYRPSELHDVRYFVRALRLARATAWAEPFTFCLAGHAGAELPFYGPRVIVLLYGEERGLLPRYRDRVGMIFKCYGTRPRLQGRARPTAVDALAFARWLRDVAHWAPGGLAQLARRARGRQGAAIHELPAGYMRQDDLPLKDILDRPYAASFLGSLRSLDARRCSFRGVFGTPKSRARAELLRSMTALRESLGEDRVYVGHNASFADSGRIGGGAYSRVLMDTRICPAPRGGLLETPRLYEGLRYGCVVVTEGPPIPGIAGTAPAIRLDGWARLPELVADLADDDDALRAAHRLSLDWWRERCSEAAVAGMIAERLAEHGAVRPPAPSVPSVPSAARGADAFARRGNRRGATES